MFATRFGGRNIRVGGALSLPVQRTVAVGRDGRAVVARGAGGLSARRVPVGGRNWSVSGAAGALLVGRGRVRRGHRRCSDGGGHGGWSTRSATASPGLGERFGGRQMTRRWLVSDGRRVAVRRSGVGEGCLEVVRAGQGGEEAAGLGGRAPATIIWIGTDARARTGRQGCAQRRGRAMLACG